MNETTEKKKNEKLCMIIAIILLAIVIGLLIMLLPLKSKYNALKEEKEKQKTELNAELQAVIAKHDSIKALYGSLADSLKVKDSIIMANAKEIQELLGYKWDYGKINKKLDLLRKITQGYVHQIDSLFVVNKELKEENVKITQQYNSEQQKTQELTKDKEELITKVESASVLKAYNVTALGIRNTSGGTEKITDKANRIEKIKVCFTLSANKLVTAGPKVVYMRIARPDNEIITLKKDDSYTFEYQGKPIQYTSKKEVQYENEAVNLCLYWSKKSMEEPAMVGRYNVSLFVDGNEIGQAFFELR